MMQKIKQGTEVMSVRVPVELAEIFREKARQENKELGVLLRAYLEWIGKKIEQKWESDERGDKSTDQGGFTTSEVD